MTSIWITSITINPTASYITSEKPPFGIIPFTFPPSVEIKLRGIANSFDNEAMELFKTKCPKYTSLSTNGPAKMIFGPICGMDGFEYSMMGERGKPPQIQYDNLGWPYHYQPDDRFGEFELQYTVSPMTGLKSIASKMKKDPSTKPMGQILHKICKYGPLNAKDKLADWLEFVVTGEVKVKQ